MATHDVSDEEDEFEDAEDLATAPFNMELTEVIDQSIKATDLFLNNKFTESRSLYEPWGAPADLHDAIQDTNLALKLFLSNKFNDARTRLEPWADRSIYHAVGFGTIMYLQATMTFDSADIEQAVHTVKRSVHVCGKQRRKTSFASSLTRHRSTDDYTKEELHAELCYAECLIERALLTFIQDENLINFIKGSLKIRACHQSYKECLRILEKRKWKDDDEKEQFESGVYLGSGLFNLMISLLPTKILKLLEFVGFSGNKQKGLSMLEKGSELQRTLRGPLCSMSLLAYHTVITYVLGTADGDIKLAEQVLAPCLVKYPKGALFLFFAGRVEEIKGNIHEAIVRFEESVDSQQEWRQFHHLCFWELMWCHSFVGDWLLAMKYAEKLCKESRWSRATYTYQKASFLLMCDDVTEDTVDHVNYLYREIPRLKQRIAGKSIPMEKFAMKKASRYADQGNRLTLPAIELIYVWNGFSIIGKKQELLEPLLTKVEATINEINKNEHQYKHYIDDYCLALLLKGVCLRWKGNHFQAEQCLNEVITYDKQLKQDPYLSAYATVELALLKIANKELEEASKLLHKAKHNHKGYSLESRLHFRIHAANLHIKAAESQDLECDDASSLVDLSPPETSDSLSLRQAASEDGMSDRASLASAASGASSGGGKRSRKGSKSSKSSADKK